MAQSVGISRRKSDELIDDGRVLVNGEVARVGQRVDEKDTVLVDGSQVKPKELTYLALNKPTGFVCSRKQQDDKPTIFSLIPDEYSHLNVAGRLDADSRGLVVLTNDGDFANELMHPSKKKRKRYEVKLNKTISDSDIERICEGEINLSDGKSVLNVVRKDGYLEVTMSEGRNRQIRRTFSELGYDVVDLYRTNIGEYGIEKLKEGKFQKLNMLHN